jgi:hypothetical protein
VGDDRYAFHPAPLLNGNHRRSIALMLCIHVADGDVRQPSGHGPISKGDQRGLPRR